MSCLLAQPVLDGLPEAGGTETASRDERWIRPLGIGVAVAVLLLAVRLQYGMGSWGDEAYQLSTAWRYVLGDRPLIESWDTNFSSAMLATPFVWAYTGLIGSTTGILVVYRLYFLLMQLIVARQMFLAISLPGGKRLGLAAALAAVLFIPFQSPFPGYGAEWQWFTVACLLAYRAFNSESPKTARNLSVASGASLFMSTAGNPTMLLGSLTLLATGSIASRRHARGVAARRSWWGAHVAFVAAGSIFVGSLLAVVWPHLSLTIAHVANPDDHVFTVGRVIGYIWWARWALVALSVSVALALGLAILKRNARGASLIAVGAWGLTVLVAVFTATGRIQTHVVPQVLLSGFALVVMATAVPRLLRTSRHFAFPLDVAALTLLVPVVAGGLGLALGSNAGLFTAMILWLPALAFGLLAHSVAFDESDGASLSDTGVSPALVATIVAVAICIGAAGYVDIPDGLPVFQLDTRVTVGPYAGVITTRDKAQAYQQEFETITRNLSDASPSQAGTGVIFLERYPLGYLMTTHRPATYSTWATAAETERLAAYLRLTGRHPHTVVRTKYHDDTALDGLPAPEPLFEAWERAKLVEENDRVSVYRAER